MRAVLILLVMRRFSAFTMSASQNVFAPHEAPVYRRMRAA